MIRVFPRRTKWTPTDDHAFIGFPPIIPLPREEEVMISVVFTWDIPAARQIKMEWEKQYDNVRMGGPALGDPGEEFVPGRFVGEGVVFTSRGCPKRCPFCLVPEREGGIRELPIRDGWVVCDNNLLACSEQHVRAVFDMLRRQPKPISFKGGLDASLFTVLAKELVDSIRLDELWFAADRPSSIEDLERVAGLLKDLSIEKKRCFVLVGYGGETIEEADRRCREVYDLGFLPFAQLFRGVEPKTYSEEWKNLARVWSRPAIYRRMCKEGSGGILMLEKFERKTPMVGRHRSHLPTLVINSKTGYGYLNKAAMAGCFRDVRWVEAMFDREARRLVFYGVTEHTKDAMTLSYTNASKTQAIISLKALLKAFGLWELCGQWDVWKWTLKPSSDGLCEINFNVEGTSGGESRGDNEEILPISEG